VGLKDFKIMWNKRGTVGGKNRSEGMSQQSAQVDWNLWAQWDKTG